MAGSWSRVCAQVALPGSVPLDLIGADAGGDVGGAGLDRVGDRVTLPALVDARVGLKRSV
jgi:hypothetical protein